MGSAIARALAAIGHRVVGISRSGRPDDAFDAVRAHAKMRDMSVFFGTGADILVLALPHTPQTDGLISPEVLQAFDAVHLVNIGRGSAIRTTTLLDALGSGRVRHAALDEIRAGVRPASAVARDRGY